MQHIMTDPDHVDVALALLREQKPVTKDTLREALKATGVEGIANARLNDTIRDAQSLHRAGHQAAPRCKFTQNMFANIHEQMAACRSELRIAADQREADAVARVARERDEARAEHASALEEIERLNARNASFSAELANARAEVARLAAALAAAEKTSIASDDVLHSLKEQVARLARMPSPRTKATSRKRTTRSKTSR